LCGVTSHDSSRKLARLAKATASAGSRNAGRNIATSVNTPRMPNIAARWRINSCRSSDSIATP